MAIFRWGTNFDPFAGLRFLQREMERLAWPWWGESRRVGGGSYPPVNVFESDGDILVQCEVAGVDADDLDVSITGETLNIKGVKKPLPDEEKLNFVRRERGSGEFTRTIVLPDQVQADQVEASLTDGVMTVRLPKATGGQARKVQVKAGT